MNMQKYMDQPLMKADCECGFMVRSHSDKEIVDIAKTHAKNIHNIKRIPKEDIKNKIKMA